LRTHSPDIALFSTSRVEYLLICCRFPPLRPPCGGGSFPIPSPATPEFAPFCVPCATQPFFVPRYPRELAPWTCGCRAKAFFRNPEQARWFCPSLTRVRSSAPSDLSYWFSLPIVFPFNSLPFSSRFHRLSSRLIVVNGEQSLSSNQVPPRPLLSPLLHRPSSPSSAD